MADYIPFISQAKSLVQAVMGDTEGARKTQNKFTKSFPVISQVRWGIELALGDKEAAIDTFKVGSRFVDGIPGIGHVKGVVHYACGDSEGGAAAMIGASRTTAVIGGSVGGFLVGGPVGAAAGAVGGGVLIDNVTSLADSLMHGKKHMHGLCRAVEKVIKHPTDGWRYLDVVVIPAADALGGYNREISLAENAVSATGLQRAHMMRKVGKIVKKVHAHTEEPEENFFTEDEEDEANVDAVVPVSNAVETDAYGSCNRRR